MKKPTVFQYASVFLLSGGISIAAANEEGAAAAAAEEPPESSGTNEVKTKSFTPCVQDEAEIFSGFSTQLAGDTTFVTTELLRAFSPMSKKRGGFPSRPKAIGIRASASLPATTSTKADYADAALQLRDAALASVTLSLMGSPYWGSTERSCDDLADEWIRPFNPDRMYFAKHGYGSHRIAPLTRAYFMHGLSLKALKTGLEDDDDDSGSALAGFGTAFVGLGFDGPVDLYQEGNAKASNGGILDLQLGYQYSYISEKTLQTLYDDTTIDFSHYGSLFARFKLAVNKHIFVDVEYVAPQGKGRDVLGDVTTFRIGYNFDKAKPTPAPTASPAPTVSPDTAASPAAAPTPAASPAPG